MDEAYTSQTCAKCGQRRKQSRKQRGLYLCGGTQGCQLRINADVNGALNIGTKVAPNLFSYIKVKDCESSGLVNRPKRIRVVNFGLQPILRR